MAAMGRFDWQDKLWMRGGNGMSAQFYPMRRAINLETGNISVGTRDGHGLVPSRAIAGIDAL